MPRTYSEFDPETEAMVHQVTHDHHRHLYDSGVTIGGLFVFAPRNKDGEPTGNALNHGGYPAYATVRITSLAERKMGLRDAVLMVDGDIWKDLPEAKRRAVIDHEMAHLVPKLNKFGVHEHDDIGRPKLKIRLHDFHFGGFHEIAARHGESSVEKSTVETLLNSGVKHGWLPGF